MSIVDSDDVLLIKVSERIGTITLNRPASRNAMNKLMRRRIPESIARLEADDDVDVIIFTGADPAFCAGLDLKELGASGSSTGNANSATAPSMPFGTRTKPIIGAINGVAITGGFELALNCDFLIASERAAFADTHARVGVMPGWGLTVLLPQAIGLRRAREMSVTGNFMGAAEALNVGLVNHVVAHEDLMTFTRSIAADIVSNDQPGVREITSIYDETSVVPVGEAWTVEARRAVEWGGGSIDAATVEARRQAITARGRRQL